MPSSRISARVTDLKVDTALQQLRREMELPTGFPDAVLAEAAEVVSQGPVPPPGAVGEPIDATDLELVTIDPPGSRDLDQALGIERRGTGYRVHYAIADVASWLVPGGALDTEARARGLTLYLPDQRVPLHPPVLSEGAASLLPAVDRPSVLWELDLDADGNVERSHARRATVRSRELLSYPEAQARIDAGHHPMLQLLREVGERREAIETARGGVSLQIPAQEVRAAPDNVHYELVYESTLPIEGWNAEISLMTGMAAAEIMIDGGVGILRTLPPPDDDTLARLRTTARALGIGWPADMSYAERFSTLDMNRPGSVALATQASRAMRGAGYLAFSAAPTIPGDDDFRHWAIAAEYAHVTAPLRRLVDRFATEAVLALCSGTPLPEWVESALPTIPRLMDSARQRERQVERGVIELMEALVLESAVGETFDATVTGLDRDRAQVTLASPPVITDMPAGRLTLGAAIRVGVVSVDTATRRIVLDLA